MNIERMNELIGIIEKLPEGSFRMTSWCITSEDQMAVREALAHPCKTTACIAGWAVLAFAPETWKVFSGDSLSDGTSDRDWDEVATELLGLDEEQSRIFYKYAGKEEMLSDMRKLVAKAKADQC